MNGYEEFKKNINSLTGIDLSLYKERQMRRRIESLIKKNSFKNFESYFLELVKHKKKIEKDNSNLYEEFLKHNNKCIRILSEFNSMGFIRKANIA